MRWKAYVDTLLTSPTDVLEAAPGPAAAFLTRLNQFTSLLNAFAVVLLCLADAYHLQLGTLSRWLGLPVRAVALIGLLFFSCLPLPPVHKCFGFLRFAFFSFACSIRCDLLSFSV